MTTRWGRWCLLTAHLPISIDGQPRFTPTPADVTLHLIVTRPILFTLVEMSQDLALEICAGIAHSPAVQHTVAALLLGGICASMCVCLLSHKCYAHNPSEDTEQGAYR
jgi:hypothetical protein